MTRRRVELIVLIIFGSGCAKYDLQYLPQNELRMMGAGEYEFKTIADTYYGDSNPRAERQRLSALDAFMKQNNYCRGGYSVSDRRSVITTRSVIGTEVRDV